MAHSIYKVRHLTLLRNVEFAPSQVILPSANSCSSDFLYDNWSTKTSASLRIPVKRHSRNTYSQTFVDECLESLSGGVRTRGIFGALGFWRFVCLPTPIAVVQTPFWTRSLYSLYTLLYKEKIRIYCNVGVLYWKFSRGIYVKPKLLLAGLIKSLSTKYIVSKVKTYNIYMTKSGYWFLYRILC